MNWYIERIFPVEKRVVKTIRPLVTKMTSLPIAGDQFFGAVERLHGNLDAVRRILTDEQTSTVRLVVNPEKMVIAEARRTYTYLSLFGYRVDAVVVNRIIPDTVTDPYFGKWKEIQVSTWPRCGSHSSRSRSSRPSCSIERWSVFPCSSGWATRSTAIEMPHRSVPRPARARAPPGRRLRALASAPVRVQEEMDIHRRGEELYVKVGTYKRNLVLPQTLQRLEIREAKLRGEHLDIHFGREPRPARAAAERGGTDG